MTPTKKKIAACAATCLIVTAMFWAAGFDFDERGSTLAMWVFSCVYLGGIATLFPFMKD